MRLRTPLCSLLLSTPQTMDLRTNMVLLVSFEKDVVELVDEDLLDHTLLLNDSFVSRLLMPGGDMF